MSEVYDQLLLTPGPTAVPQRVLDALNIPMIHHRTKQFQAILERVNTNLKKVFLTKHPVITLSSSGTGAMEAAIINLFSPGDKVIACHSGKFGERFSDIAKAFGLNVIDVTNEYGVVVSADDVKKALEQHKDAKGVLTTLLETSTAVLHPIQEIAAVVRQTSAVLLVDAVSGLICDPLYMDEWGVDVVVSGSQKGLMLPPGLAFIAMNEKAQKMMVDSTTPKYYLCLKAALKAFVKNDTPYTPAVSLIRGLDVALDLILDEGIENVWKRHAVAALWVRNQVTNLGLELFAKAPSNAVTAISMPEGLKSEDLIRFMRDERSVIMANGQGHIKGKIVRFAHMGETAKPAAYERGYRVFLEALKHAGYVSTAKAL